MMDLIKVLKRMDSLIQSGSTGRPEDFARKLYISERSLFYYLSIMKYLGAPIKYSRSSTSYLYSIEGRFIFEFEKLSDSEYVSG